MAKKYFTWEDLSIRDINNSEALSNCEWLNDFLEEKKNNPYPKLKYSPFNLWVHKEHTSKYVNVNEDGFRIVTGNQKNTDKKLFVFGDSVIFGEYYLRDEDTLPSIIAKELSANNKKYEVYNFAQTGYTIMNQLVLFIKLLSEGNVPNKAFFYIGINEVYVNSLLGLKHIAIDTFEKNQLFGYSFKKYLKNKIFNKVFNRKKYYELETNKKDLTNNAERIISEVNNLINMLNNLANLYNVEIEIFLTPTLFSASKRYSKEECELLQHINSNYDELNKIYNYAYDKISKNSLLSNVSDIYDDTKEAIFMDFCHTNHLGQKKLAIESIKKSGILYC